MPGRVVVLNGASSTGKSSIVRAFCDRRGAAGEFWFHAGLDDVLAKVSHPWIDVGWSVGPGPHAAHGMMIVDTADGPSVRIGPLLRQLIEWYQDGVARMAHGGVDVIVDECVLDDELRDRWAGTLAGLTVRWVAVRCDPAEMSRRERARGDRPNGLAEAQATTVHRGITYDLELDTTHLEPAAAAATLEALIGG